jgi:hypothetical protein
MKMRTGEMPVECGQLGAMNTAIDFYFECCGQDHKISQGAKYHGWCIMIILLINGHLVHNKIKLIPFSPIKDVDEQSCKVSRIKNSIQAPFVSKGILIEGDKKIIKSYKTYIARYDTYIKEEDAKRIAMELAASNPSQENGAVQKKCRTSYSND